MSGSGFNDFIKNMDPDLRKNMIDLMIKREKKKKFSSLF